MAGLAAGLIFFLQRHHSEVPVTQIPNEMENLPALITFPDGVHIYYKLPDRILERVRTLSKEAQAVKPSKEEEGRCLSFGAKLFFDNHNVIWDGNLVTDNGLFYRDTADILGEYSQYLTFIYPSIRFPDYYSNLLLLDSIVQPDGYLDESKLSEKQMDIIIERRKRRLAEKSN